MPMTALGGQLGVVDENSIIIVPPIIVIPPVTPPVTPPVIPPVTPPVTPPSVADDPSGEASVSDVQLTSTTTGSLAGVAGQPAGGSQADSSFSSFVASLSSRDGRAVISPRALRAAISRMDDKQRQAALAYIGEIIDNPFIPMSDKALFSSIRNDLQQ